MPREWTPEGARAETEARTADILRRRPVWLKDYRNELRRRGMEESPVPIVLEGNKDGHILNGYHPRLEAIAFRGTYINGARFTDYVDPQGAAHRSVMLLTSGDIGRPPCFEATVNGVTLLFRWNGMRPHVQWLAEVITAEEVAQIRGIPTSGKAESSPPDSEDEIIMEAMRTWTGKRRRRKDKWQGAPAWRPLQKATGVKFGINRRNALYLRIKEHSDAANSD